MLINCSVFESFKIQWIVTQKRLVGFGNLFLFQKILEIILPLNSKLIFARSVKYFLKNDLCLNPGSPFLKSIRHEHLDI